MSAKHEGTRTKEVVALMAKIKLAGTWMWLWSLWHVAWLGRLIWAPFMFTPHGCDLYTAILYTAFLPLEIVGTIDGSNDPQGSTEYAKTMSQFRQFAAQRGSSWAWMAAGTGLIDSWLVGSLVYHSSPVLGVLVGLMLVGWLTRHYGWRQVFG